MSDNKHFVEDMTAHYQDKYLAEHQTVLELQRKIVELNFELSEWNERIEVLHEAVSELQWNCSEDRENELLELYDWIDKKLSKDA